MGVQTPFGMLFLDPARLFVLGSFRLDGAGAGQLRLPFQLSSVVNVRFGMQAFTIGARKLGASKAETVYVDTGPGFAWVSTCTMNKQGCVKVKFHGASGSKIEVIHNDGTRAGNTPMWSGTIPNPPKQIKSGYVCPPSWNVGESIVIKVDGKVIRTIYR
jgi:hypothetical protein